MWFRATKTYGHDLGLSCAFRQWRARSHCRFVHGYALAFSLAFEAAELDRNGWVIDFGALKPVREFLCNTFDHKLVVAADDPELEGFHIVAEAGAIDLVILPSVGCESFASYVACWVESWLRVTAHAPRVRLVSVECREHGANSATVFL